MYTDYICHLPQLLTDPIAFSIQPTLCPQTTINQEASRFNLCGPYVFECGSIAGTYSTYQSYTLKGNWFSLSQHLWIANGSINGGGLFSLPLYAGIFIWLLIAQSCACCHKHCEFTSGIALLYLENPVSCDFSTASISCSLFPSLFWSGACALGGGGG